MFTNQLLDFARNTADHLPDQLVAQLFSEGKGQYIHSYLSEKSELPQTFSRFRESVKEEAAALPAEEILKGQKVYAKYAREIMMALGMMSLPYCYAGTPGNKALYLSEKMRKSPAKRLFDTARFVIGVSMPGSFAEGGTAVDQIVRTRIAHSVARWYLKKGLWEDGWGTPLNQEELAGTNLAFSYIALQGLRKMGVELADTERASFLLLWHHVGKLLGIEQQLLPSDYNSAFHLTQLIRKRNFAPSKEGKTLARELVSYLEMTLPARQAPLVEAQMSHFLGEEISSFLDLKPRPILFAFAEAVTAWGFIINKIRIVSDSGYDVQKELLKRATEGYDS